MSESLKSVQKAVDQELTHLVNKIVSMLTEKYKSLENKKRMAMLNPDTLENMAVIAECNIRQSQIKELMNAVRPMISQTVNRMVVTSIKIEDS